MQKCKIRTALARSQRFRASACHGLFNHFPNLRAAASLRLARNIKDSFGRLDKIIPMWGGGLPVRHPDGGDIPRIKRNFHGILNSRDTDPDERHAAILVAATTARHAALRCVA